MAECIHCGKDHDKELKYLACTFLVDYYKSIKKLPDLTLAGFMAGELMARLSITVEEIKGMNKEKIRKMVEALCGAFEIYGEMQVQIKEREKETIH